MKLGQREPWWSSLWWQRTTSTQVISGRVRPFTATWEIRKHEYPSQQQSKSHEELNECTTVHSFNKYLHSFLCWAMQGLGTTEKGGYLAPRIWCSLLPLLLSPIRLSLLLLSFCLVLKTPWERIWFLRSVTIPAGASHQADWLHQPSWYP